MPTWQPHQHLAEAVTVLLGREKSTSEGPAPTPSVQGTQSRTEGLGPSSPRVELPTNVTRSPQGPPGSPSDLMRIWD